MADEGCVYLAVIVDIGTRRVVGWAMSERMSAKLVCDALKMAYWRRRQEPGHSRFVSIHHPAQCLLQGDKRRQSCALLQFSPRP